MGVAQWWWVYMQPHMLDVDGRSRKSCGQLVLLALVLYPVQHQACAGLLRRQMVSWAALMQAEQWRLVPSTPAALTDSQVLPAAAGATSSSGPFRRTVQQQLYMCTASKQIQSVDHDSFKFRVLPDDLSG
jgi:hypothetical protein